MPIRYLSSSTQYAYKITKIKTAFNKHESLKYWNCEFFGFNIIFRSGLKNGYAKRA